MSKIKTNPQLAGARYRNLKALWRRCTPGDMMTGAAWYADARTHVERLAEVTQRPTSVVAAVFAALSPQCAWSYQMRASTAFVASNGATSHAGYGTNITKARAILRGADPDATLGGPKVRAFWQNLSGDGSPVTIDRHATDAARNARGSYDRKPPAVVERRAIDSAYRRLANEVGAEPSTLQAILWVAWRRTHGITR